MLIHIFQGADPNRLETQVNQLTSSIPVPPDSILQSQSSVPNPKYVLTVHSPEHALITLVTITVCYK